MFVHSVARGISGPIGHRIGGEVRKQDQLKHDESTPNADLSGVDHMALTYSGAMSVTDLIETVQPGRTIGGLIVSQYQNRSKATLQGAERGGSYEIKPGAVDARDGTTDGRLTGRAIRTFKAALNYRLGA
jgi:hypothetical protein